MVWEKDAFSHHSYSSLLWTSPWKKQWITKTVAWGRKEVVHLMDLYFADDIALLASTRAELQSMSTNLEREAGKIGLRLDSENMKVMIIRKAMMVSLIIIGHQTTEEVKHFVYLGSVVDKNGKVEGDRNSRIEKASLTFQRLCSQSGLCFQLCLRTKILLYNILILPTANYTSKTWKMTSSIVKKLNVFHQDCLHRVLGVQ